MSSSPTLASRPLAATRASDPVLMRHIAAGDAEAFEELYRRHIRRAVGQARKLCASSELAEEVAQETFISLWRSAHRYRPALGSVSTWLAGMVRNRAIDAWRRSAARPVEVPAAGHGSGQLHGDVVADAGDPDRAFVLSLIARLPPAQKDAVFLAYFGGMTHHEIAAWADVPLGTIKSRIRLGVEKLRHEAGQETRPGRTELPGAVPAPAPAAVAELRSARRRRDAAELATRRLTRLTAA